MMRGLPLLVVLVACGPKAGGDGDGDGEGDGDGDSTISASASGASGGDEGAESETTHGSVKIELRRGDSQASDPYVGTASVTVTMQYGECLQGFYEQNPGLRQDGQEGEMIFEHWRTAMLCLGRDAQEAECVVDSIDQFLDQRQLTLEYSILGPLENQILVVAPLPTKDTAGCPDPEVRMLDVRGADAQGQPLWVVESFSPTTAFTDQGGAIEIRAARQ